MTKSKTNLIDQIRQAVRESGLTKRGLATLAGIDETAVSRFHSGERGLSMESLDALADVLNLRIVADGKPRKVPPASKPGRPRKKGKVTR